MQYMIYKTNILHLGAWRYSWDDRCTRKNLKEPLQFFVSSGLSHAVYDLEN